MLLVLQDVDLFQQLDVMTHQSLLQYFIFSHVLLYLFFNRAHVLLQKFTFRLHLHRFIHFDGFRFALGDHILLVQGYQRFLQHLVIFNVFNNLPHISL